MHLTVKPYKTILAVCLPLAIIIACRQHYLPPVLSINKSYLVVDGIIVPGNDSTILLLSRTIKVSDTLKPQAQPEIGAHVQLLGEANDTRELVENGNGRYVSAGLNVNTGEKYQLNITTASGLQYVSDFVPVKQSPPIDSLNWDRDTLNNVQVYVASHDETHNTTYYKWDYIETWQYHSSFNSYYDWKDNRMVFRTNDEHVYNCWKTFPSTNVNIGSTIKLTQDVVYRQPVVTVPIKSQKIWVKYSVLVKQYALTQDAYNFWDAVNKTSEQLGSLFDAQPSQLPGNIHCVGDTSQLVIGFVSISSRQTKRLFIDYREVPDWQYLPYYNDYDCGEKNVSEESMSGYFPPGGPYFFTLIGQPLGHGGYLIANINCIDCRENGGTNVKPSFWP